MKTLPLIVAALAALTTAAVAAPISKAASVKTTALICPVTGTKIASAAKAYSQETYKVRKSWQCKK